MSDKENVACKIPDRKQEESLCRNSSPSEAESCKTPRSSQQSPRKSTPPKVLMFHMENMPQNETPRGKQDFQTSKTPEGRQNADNNELRTPPTTLPPKDDQSPEQELLLKITPGMDNTKPQDAHSNKPCREGSSSRHGYQSREGFPSREKAYYQSLGSSAQNYPTSTWYPQGYTEGLQAYHYSQAQNYSQGQNYHQGQHYPRAEANYHGPVHASSSWAQPQCYYASPYNNYSWNPYAACQQYMYYPHTQHDTYYHAPYQMYPENDFCPNSAIENYGQTWGWGWGYDPSYSYEGYYYPYYGYPQSCGYQNNTGYQVCIAKDSRQFFNLHTCLPKNVMTAYKCKR